VSGFPDRIRRANLSPLCMVLAAIMLGHALQIKDGFYHPVALLWVTGALLLCALGVLTHRFATDGSSISERILRTALIAGIVWQIGALLTARSPGMYLSDEANVTLFGIGVGLQAALVAAGVAAVAWLRRWWFPAFLAVSAGLGVWIIHASPVPYIDVITVHKEAINAVLDGRDPYRISFENIYGSESRHFYNPTAVIGNRIAFAYPYPPASLLLAVPGHVLFGDYRYSELAWLITAAALIGYSRRALVAQLAGCLLLTTPRVWFVVEQGWTEPIAIFALALTAFLLTRNPVASGWAAGVLVVTKQYLGFTGLSVLRLLFLHRAGWIWMAIGLVLAACAITLPHALWHPHAFMRNVVWLQMQEPFRPDSLSYLSWAARAGMGQGSFVWAIGAAVVGALVSLAATRNTSSGFAASIAFTTLAMFAFGSKAFCNYYFFVIGALCCGVACTMASGAETASATAERGEVDVNRIP
jgi:hypothetical protein